MPITESDISLVIPAYNEEKRIETVLLQYVQSFPTSTFIVVVEGNDKTPAIVSSYAKNNPKIKAIISKQRLGKGGAVLKGIHEASTEIVGFIDCDTSVGAHDISVLISKLPECDVVIGSRRLPDSVISVHQPFLRRIASSFFNTLIRFLFGLPYLDTQCGAKFFHTSAIQSHLEEMQSTGFEFDVELLWRLHKKGYKICECPVSWKHSDDSTFSLKYAFGMFASLLKIRLISPKP